MQKHIVILLLLSLSISCRSKKVADSPYKPVSELTIAFGSCNKHTIKNSLWNDVLASEPDLWIWGGDNIYADTPDANAIAKMYKAQKRVPGYHKLRKKVPVIGTWDDHDYGLNDGGEEWVAKRESQQAFLDFLDVPANSPRRSQEGIYTAHRITTPQGTVDIIVLDTRYFRSSLTPDRSGEKRYVPNEYGQGTVLGEAQWSWLGKALKNTTADFNIIVSSIQFLSDQHGFETWGNFPHEVDRLKGLIEESGAKGVFILSGDRHISEFSITELDHLDYPLIDFTSSGLTHAYREFDGEPNPYRLGQVVNTESFGLVRLNFTNKTVRFQIVGDEGAILADFEQQY